MSTNFRVILNDRVLLQPLTGVGNYVRQLLGAFEQLEDAPLVRPFTTGTLRLGRSSGQQQHQRIPPQKTRVASRLAWPIRRSLQGAYALGFSLARRAYDVYHEPNHIPIACNGPVVTTIHDLSVLMHPEWHPDDRVRWYEREFEQGRRRTTRFIAASRFTKQEMVRQLGIPAARIDVTYQAPRPGFGRVDATESARVRAAYDLPAQFFLYVGTLEPRKNVTGLLEAFSALPSAERRRCPLVLAGGWGWKLEHLRQRVSAHGLANDARLLGYVSDADLAALYTSATALVWPSFYEGFGLPPLEALSCGCPVVTSAVASLPEVVGEAGVLLDPQDTASWTEAMRRMRGDDAWRQRWQVAGPARAREFAWSRCARETIACYAAALAGD